MAATRVGRWAAYGDTPTYLIKRALQGEWCLKLMDLRRKPLQFQVGFFADRTREIEWLSFPEGCIHDFWATTSFGSQLLRGVLDGAGEG